MKTGFTLIEVLAVISIMLIICAISLPTLYRFQEKRSLDEAVFGIMGNLRLASKQSSASQGDSPWGIYFNTVASPQSYTLFKGVDFANRQSQFDEIHQLSDNLEIFIVNLAGGGDEVVFQKINGQTNYFGQVSLRLKKTPTDNRVIFIEQSGNVSLAQEIVNDANRLKDSRHIHFSYNRVVDTLNEKIILNFNNGAVIRQIDFVGHLSAGQFFWQDNVMVGGVSQTVTIQTIRLNNPDTLFCIHRDLRYNNTNLAIDIDGDVNYPAFSPTLINYDQLGNVAGGSSAFVSAPIWQ